MNKYPILKNPPLREALIDIRVKLAESVDTKSIAPIYDSIKKQYSEKQEEIISEFRFDSEGEQVKSSGDKINGYRFITPDKKQIVQIRLDGFTFSRLHPYITWEELFAEAHRLWELYRNITSPELITRVALRYINNLNIPIPIKDFGDYLTEPPTIPEGLPQGVSSFFNRLVISEPSIGANAIITQALEQVGKNTVPIILDIDVFKHQPNGMGEKEVWETIKELRQFKNDIFFKSITSSLRKMYQ